MTRWRDFTTSVGMMLLLVFAGYAELSVTRTDSAAAADVEKGTLLEHARNARYLDPRLFAADPDYYKWVNIIVHGKVLDAEQLTDSSGPYTSIYTMAEVRDSDTKVPLVIEVLGNTLLVIEAPLLVDECYRFYGFVSSSRPVVDSVSGAVRELPSLQGYWFELVAHDGYGGCEAP